MVLKGRYPPFVLLLLARLRELVREPEGVFWAFFFPIAIAIGLGLAFPSRPTDDVIVGVIESPYTSRLLLDLKAGGIKRVRVLADPEATQQLLLGAVSIVVVPGTEIEYRFDLERPEGVLSRHLVDGILQRSAGRIDSFDPHDKVSQGVGARYIDFLIPGLLGLNIMSGGMWGVGFVLVQMRSHKLLKLLVVTPMRRTDFLGAICVSRLILVLLQLVILLLFGRIVFDMNIRGSMWTITLIALLGGMVFCGLGLLVGSRTAKLETASGLMNLVMLPMSVLSGIFFSSERFPAWSQAFVRVLPLTALNNALRGTILAGADLKSQSGNLLILGGWALLSSLLALRLFRWN